MHRFSVQKMKPIERNEIKMTRSRPLCIAHRASLFGSMYNLKKKNNKKMKKKKTKKNIRMGDWNKIQKKATKSKKMKRCKKANPNRCTTMSHRNNPFCNRSVCWFSFP
jgi:hypothetical protein